MDRILKKAFEMRNELVKTRRYLHMHPELGMEEFLTQKFIMKELKKLGIPASKMVGTGVVGLIKCRPGGKTILLRADMDALPVTEENNVPYRSKQKGLMHACGHDTHVTLLLGAAKLLNGMKKVLKGNVKLVFQPREELRDTPFDPAEQMVKDGVLKYPKVSAAAAFHVNPSIPLGSVNVVHGPVMANGDVFEIKIKGVGSHGAEPHMAKDPIHAAACVIQALQSVVSRNVHALDSAVVSVTTVHGGSAKNIIPPEVLLSGTIRTLSDRTKRLVMSSVTGIAKNTCRGLGLTAEVSFKNGYPTFSNNEGLAVEFERSAGEAIGKKNILNGKPSMGCENFAFFTRGCPGLLVWLGVKGKKKQYALHNPRFDIDEKALCYGAGLMAKFASDYLSKSL